MVEEVTNMRDDIEAAIATLGEDSGMEPAPDYVPSTEGETRNAESKTAEEETAPETTAGAVSDEETGKPTDDTIRRVGETESGDKGSEQASDGIEKAPETWQPEAREGWKDIPESVRTQIHKRETEINKALLDGSDNRKRGEQFSDIAGRYAQVIAAEGVADPIQGFEEMMKVLAQLRMGNPQQKAQKIAEFIGGYGVDIEMLDDILSATPGKGANGAAAPAGDPNRQYIDQQLAPVHQLLGRLNDQEKQANLTKNQAYMAEVIKFKSENEFYTDVQNDMADMCEMAANRGYDMPLAEAYSKACAMNPAVSKVIADRTETDRLAADSKTLLSKRNAASSLMGGQSAGPVVGSEDLDLRGDISAAFDAQDAQSG